MGEGTSSKTSLFLEWSLVYPPKLVFREDTHPVINSLYNWGTVTGQLAYRAI